MPDEKKLDETIPGGKYIRGDEYVDAEGKSLGKVSGKDAEPETPAPAEPTPAPAITFEAGTPDTAKKK